MEIEVAALTGRVGELERELSGREESAVEDELEISRPNALLLEREGEGVEKMLQERQLARARDAVVRLERKLAGIRAPPMERDDAAAWDMLSPEGKRSARKREVDYATWFFTSRAFFREDLATALYNTGWLEELWDTKEVTALYFEKVRALMMTLEGQHFGIDFTMYLHLEQRMTGHGIVRLAQAGSQLYDPVTNTHSRKVLLSNPYLKGDVIYVPRVAGTRGGVAAEMAEAKRDLGIEIAENGRVSLRPL